MPAAQALESATALSADLNESDLRAKILRIFKKRPCDFQYKLLQAQQHGKNIISVARTGSGKTLTYFMPLVMSDNSIIIIVTALNVLGEQFEREAQAAGFAALSVNGENESDSVFKDIKSLKYRVLIFSPDIMMKRGGRCQTVLWTAKTFVSKIQRVIFDEAHCILQWGQSFRPEYKAAANISFYLPNVPIYLSSATMPPPMISQLKQVFHLTDKNTAIFQRSNDRPNIAIVVRRMEHPQDSYEDLAFLVPKGWKEGDLPPPKFMVFFDNKKDAEAAAKFLWSRVSIELQTKIPWFHAGMTKYFRVEQVARLRGDEEGEGEVWGFIATDSGGLGLDVPNVGIVVQYKTAYNLDTIIQRFGRAVRDVRLQGVAILLAEPHWFYEDLLRRDVARKRRTLKRKAKSKNSADPSQNSPAKRRRAHGSGEESANIAPSSHNIMISNLPLSPSKRANQMHSPASTSSQRSLMDSLGIAPPLYRTAETVRVEAIVESDGEEEDDLDFEGRAANVQSSTNTPEEQAVVDEEEILAMIQEGVAVRSRGTKTSLASRPPRVPDRGTCLFINAHNLTGKQHCRRWHTNQYYANHLASRDSSTCCERCEAKTPTICCDVCQPDQVAALIPVRNDAPPERPRKPRRINIKDFKMSESGNALQEALFRWRNQMAEKLFGEYYKEFGGKLLMHHRIIERVVQLADANKLKTTKDLQDQTAWAWTSEYGDQVLELVREYSKTTADLPVTPSEARQESAAEGSAVPRRSRASPTCSSCGETGHKRNSGRCPINIAARQNENQTFS